MGLSALGIEYGSYLLVGAIFVLLLTGQPLAWVTGLVALIFTFGWFGPMALPLVTSRIFGFITEYSLVAIPMFILMAALLDRSGIAKSLFNGMRILAGRLPGGVAVQTLIVAILMAAMSGVIGGEIVLLGILALPQMLRLGYDRNLSIGVVCAGGSLGTMMPPSIVLIIYGLVANASIADLFIAAITPALMLLGFYVAYVLFICWRNPDLGPPMSKEEAAQESLGSALKSLSAPLFIVFVVLGSIYGGIASITEAAAMGVSAVLIIALIRRELTLRMLQDSLVHTLQTCGMIIWIGIAAAVLVGVYNLMGGNRFVAQSILGIEAAPVVIIMVMMLILLVLGMFLDWIGIALLTLPIFVPIVIQLGYDPIWFGILFAVNMQVSYLTPPFGPAAFYLKSVAPKEITLKHIYTALLPFIALQLVVLLTILFFPPIATWLI
ncbi:TRAP transporter, DctM subunit [Pseudooceanicola antarcticus]|uniref:TRAP transporter large permease protein n=1 Tax=Pseudooceanicola antarcticus TaxID=1247613 RepID=A0A285JE93_9RHOB|nr:TRAP transporter large permease subunit [Pseudooceanicola antarcticus]PJE31128.1 C4-dicarboxylate ABC transporter permease [Pseudooceanicola antarcticus]SNY58578.1 TRAP transporter, DctM subunit [Pseudooceanicola antarcticus]